MWWSILTKIFEGNHLIFLTVNSPIKSLLPSESQSKHCTKNGCSRLPEDNRLKGTSIGAHSRKSERWNTLAYSDPKYSWSLRFCVLECDFHQPQFGRTRGRDLKVRNLSRKLSNCFMNFQCWEFEGKFTNQFSNDLPDLDSRSFLSKCEPLSTMCTKCSSPASAAFTWMSPNTLLGYFFRCNITRRVLPTAPTMSPRVQFYKGWTVNRA